MSHADNRIEWDDHVLTTELMFVAPTVFPESDVIRFRELLKVLDSHINGGVSTFEMEAAGPVDVYPVAYSYNFVTVDGRTWNQMITFQDQLDKNPSMTFDVPTPGWRLSEFVPHRELRLLVIKWVNSHGLTKAGGIFK